MVSMSNPTHSFYDLISETCRCRHRTVLLLTHLMDPCHAPLLPCRHHQRGHARRQRLARKLRSEFGRGQPRGNLPQTHRPPAAEMTKQPSNFWTTLRPLLRSSAQALDRSPEGSRNSSHNTLRQERHGLGWSSASSSPPSSWLCSTSSPPSSCALPLPPPRSVEVRHRVETAQRVEVGRRDEARSRPEAEQPGKI